MSFNTGLLDCFTLEDGKHMLSRNVQNTA